MRRLLVLATLGVALWAAPGALAAGWCGTGESATDRQDVLTGQQVHAIVVLPSDSADTFAADANQLADDVTSMTTWWAGQDPTRIPRFDMAAFPGGTCLDISFVRLGEPASAFSGASTAFNEVTSELRASGFSSFYEKYYVYYDGPPVEDGVCGVGQGEFDNEGGPGFAMVFPADCAGIPTDSVGTHELLHALGALPQGAPNACTPATDPLQVYDLGHPCDSTTDVLYPFTTGAPLSQQVLDFNHDDYYAHSGTWIDIQDSLWLHRLDLPQVPLAVSLNGAGAVTSDLPGIDCTASCTTQWDQGSLVNLHARAVPGRRFIQWLGACSGSGDCSLDVTAPEAATAVFGPAAVPVRLAIAGHGRIECSPRCTKTLTAGARLTLRALPAKGWKFVTWTGSCKGKRLTCVPATTAALSIKATFTKMPKKKAPKKR